MMLGLDLTKWKVRDFWAAVGAGIATITGGATATNHIRGSGDRRRTAQMEKRNRHLKIRKAYKDGDYSFADRDRAYVEQDINPREFISESSEEDLSKYVGQPSQDNAVQSDVAQKKTAKLESSMRRKSKKSKGSKMGSISLSNDLDNTIAYDSSSSVTANTNNTTSYDSSPSVGWTANTNNTNSYDWSDVIYDKRPTEQFVLAQATPSTGQNLTSTENLNKPRNLTGVFIAAFFVSAGLYLVIINKLRQTTWFTKNFESYEWTIEKIEKLEHEINKLEQGQKEILANQAKMFDLLKK